MGKPSYGYQILVANETRTPFENRSLRKSPSLRQRASDVDFSDVFGGPPRRLISETRNSMGETRDPVAFRSGKAAEQARNSWSALGEKPVFGAESPLRRRQLDGDFFDDVFGGSEEFRGSNSRNYERDPFASKPVSTTSSPANQTLSKLEHLSGGSTLAAQIGLPTKAAAVSNNPIISTPCSPVRSKKGSPNAFTFLSPPRTGMVRVSSESKIARDHTSRPSFRQSPLSHEFSLVSDGLSEESESTRQDTGSQFSKDSNNSETASDGSQFHFSIYKWASKGVPLIMPFKRAERLLPKEHSKTKGIVNGLAAPTSKGADLSSSNKNMPSTSYFQNGNHDLRALMKSDVVEQPMPSNAKLTPTRFSKEPENAVGESKLHSDVSCNLHFNCQPSDRSDEPENRITRPAGKVGVSKVDDLSAVNTDGSHEVNLNCQINDYSEKSGKGVGRPAGWHVGVPKVQNWSAENLDDSTKVMKRIGGKLVFNHDKVKSPGTQCVENKEDKKQGKEKGKVKEFVKIFDHEVPSKLSHNADNLGRSARRTNLVDPQVEDFTSRSVGKADEGKIDYVHSKKTLTDTHVTVDQIEKGANTSACEINGSFLEKDDTSASCPEASREGFKQPFGNPQRSLAEVLHVHSMVEQLPDDIHRKEQQTGRVQDEIESSDAKLERWLNGKEGNIRSLLSTLQYVLWPDSGWKPVPLVDIVEGTAVKRAYQRALLCLHPDKLQQKGALTHQQYIAEKLFDILQEAWDHFTSLSSV